MFKVKDLHIVVGKTHVLKGVSLKIKPGEIHAIMGPNGSGKSTLANAIVGNPKFKIKSGKMFFGKTQMNKLGPDKRAQLGLFLAFQHPQPIPGVSVFKFLRTAATALCKARGIRVPFTMDFFDLLKKKAHELRIDPKLLDRDLNDGFSGGEKKKMEMLQAAILAPKMAIFDEIDSGLDIDALKTVSKTINALSAAKCGVLIITHYQRILRYVKPDVVHVMINGQIVKSGGAKLGEELEKKGYGAFA